LDYFNNYISKINAALKTIDENSLNKCFLEIVSRVNSSNNIYLLGNGGSQANAHHISGDFIKTFSVAGLKLKISCLADNVCYMTAASNDYSFEDAYSLLVGNIIDEGDLIVYLSGSGNSINLVKCARKAKSKNIKQIAITGYNGGALNSIVDLPIHVKIDDMEIAEDAQLIIFHFLKQQLVAHFKDKFIDSTGSKYIKRVTEDLVS
tara:strand:+ start:634 stop:1251 length:618 start_codon:yes stop_codon:yes gene_type:complete